MNCNLSDIINYFQFVEKKFKLNISYHHPLCNSFLGDNVSIIKKYNSHCNQYCSHIKSNPDLYKKCLEQQYRVVEKCGKNIFLGMSFCGLEEFIIPLYTEHTTLGFISIGGFTTNYDRSVEKISKLEEYDIDKNYLIDYLKTHNKAPINIKEAQTLFSLPSNALSQLLRDYYNANKSSKYNIYSEIISYISLNYKNRISVNDIANFCLCSESYINHTFKKASGMSINQYINTKRMSEAKKLLKHTALPVSQIAISVGFSEPNYFTNTFKKMFGISPSDYRKN